MSPSEKPVVAVFDFDGTLTFTDTFVPFLRHVAGRGAFWSGMVVLTPSLLAYAFRLHSNTQIKERLLKYFLGDRSRESLYVRARDFCGTRLLTLLNPLAMERLRWHQQQGHRVILLSASVDLYLDEWARRNGITEVLVTALETASGIVTGRIVGTNCHGQEKLRRLQAHLGEIDDFSIDAYGDSGADRFVLAAVDRGHFRAFGRGFACRWHGLGRFLAAVF